MPRPIATKSKRSSPVRRSAHPARRVGTRVGACGGQKRVELFLACGQIASVRAALNPCKTRRELRSCGNNRVRCTSLHKYAYVHGDPIGAVDPSGLMSLTSSIGSMSIGMKIVSTAALGAGLAGGFTSWTNYATNRPLTEGLGVAMMTGAIALPLSMYIPAVGVLFAGLGIFSAATTNYTVWTNPRSTTSQKGVAAFLLFASAIGGVQARANVKANGWFNPKAFQRTPYPYAEPLTQESTLAELMPEGLSDNAMIHATTAEPHAFSNGVNRHTFFVRWGDVKNLTLREFRIGVVGPNAPGSQPAANTFVIIEEPMVGVFQKQGSVNMLGVTEYTTTGPSSKAPSIVIVQDGGTGQ